MKIAIRVDASNKIGYGHLMRCLVLADKFKESGFAPIFIMQDFGENVNKVVSQKGYVTHLFNRNRYNTHGTMPVDEWHYDCKATSDILKIKSVDILIVDHYGIDYRWHKIIRTFCQTIVVIDDLANRKLDCDFLIDQTYKRLEIEYIPYVPANCKILVGSKYAILRSEFGDLRRLALIKRNKSHKIKNILVSMGGVDRQNKTKIVMDVLHGIEWKEKILVNVVVGTQSKNININNSNNIRVLLYKNALNMAKLMFDADLSIGCAGTTSWERCCLSLPSLVTASVDNQQVILKTLEKFGAIKVWSDKVTLQRQIKKIITNDQEWHCMKLKSYNVCDGRGAERIMDELNDVYC